MFNGYIYLNEETDNTIIQNNKYFLDDMYCNEQIAKCKKRRFYAWILFGVSLCLLFLCTYIFIKHVEMDAYYIKTEPSVRWENGSPVEILKHTKTSKVPEILLLLVSISLFIFSILIFHNNETLPYELTIIANQYFRHYINCGYDEKEAYNYTMIHLHWSPFIIHKK